MSKYNAGDKFIIEIGEIFTGDCSIRNRLEERYAIKGFNALMFDNNGLDRLQRYDGNTCLDGVQAGLESLDCSVRNAYEKGLSDAWELARKISLHVTDGGVDMSPSELRTVFDIEPMVDPTYCILRDYKAEEVINRLKSYEDNKIEVGDFVYNDDFCCVSNCRQSVRDNKYCFVFHQVFNCLLYNCFGFIIQCRCCFV